MNLKSFGCSFIYGSELSDDRGTTNHPSKLTWPALIAKKLGYNYECYAKPASGNLQILEKILNQIDKNNNDLFVVSWSWVDRFDFYPETFPFYSWCTLLPTDDSTAARVYYKELHSEYKDKLTSLSYIKLAIDTLNQKNIPFIMTYMDDLLFDQQWHKSPAVLELQNYIKPHMTTFNGSNFLDWSRKNGYKETQKWHPLEEAHQAAADHMLPFCISKV